MSAADPGETRRARAWLSRVVEPGSGAVHRLVAACGPVETMWMIRSGQAPDEVCRLAAARRGDDRARDDLAEAARLGVRLVTPEDDEWPDGLLHAMEVATARGVAGLAPPQALWVRGSVRLDEALARSVAVVGSRGATAYGCRLAGDLAYGLAVRSWTVVSGGAYGIDGAAHSGAMSAGRTIAVVAGGLRSPYPGGHARLFRRIGESGLLVSEWPPDSPAQRHRFLIRNRLIAAFGAGTVVVEAGVRSGALSTANRARDLGRPLMAAPGPAGSAMSVGTHQLIREEHACLATSAEHVLEAVGAIGDDLAPLPRAALTARDRLDPLARRVLDGLPATASTSPDSIAVSAGVPVVDVLRCLPALEIRGFVESTPGGWRLTAAARA